MAKKTSIKKEGQLPDPLELITKIDKESEILSDSIYSNIPDWISCGSYICNATLSGSIFKGIPVGRISSFCGENSTGKSFLACSVCREAQKKGYIPYYLDSEGAMTKDFFSRIGGDPSKMIIRQVNTVSEVSQIVLTLLDTLIEQQKEYGDHNKYIIVIDSLANISTTKEVNDTAGGSEKVDMTRSKEWRKFFRVVSVKLAETATPLIACNQVYASQDMFNPGNRQATGGGIAYNSSVTLELFASKLQDKANDNAAAKATNSEDVIKTGILVKMKPKKSRFAIPRVGRLMIPFYKKINPYFGLETYMTWDNSGVCRGSIITQKEYDKLTDGEKKKVHTFEFNGETKYAYEKETARGIVVSHLGEAIPVADFFTDKVFTEDFLKKLDDNVIRPAFELPDQNAFDDIKEIEDLIDVNSGDAEE